MRGVMARTLLVVGTLAIVVTTVALWFTGAAGALATTAPVESAEGSLSTRNVGMVLFLLVCLAVFWRYRDY